MTTRQTLVADVLDALVTIWSADATLTAYGDRLRVFDGPPLLDRAAEIEVWVGADGLDADETVNDGEQAFATFDATDDRDETLNITCTIWVAEGSTDMGSARRTAVDVFNAAMSAVSGTDLSLGDDVYDATTVGTWRLRQAQTTNGAQAIITFTVQVSGMV